MLWTKKRIIVAIAEESSTNPAVTNAIRKARDYEIPFILTRLSGIEKHFEIRFYCKARTQTRQMKKALKDFGIKFKTL